MLQNWNQSPNVVKLLQIFPFEIWQYFWKKKKKTSQQNVPFLFLFFASHQNFQGKTKTGMDHVVKWTSNDDPVSRAQYYHPHSFLGNEKLVNNQPSS